MYKIEAVVSGPFFPILKEKLLNISGNPADLEILTAPVRVDGIDCGLHRERKSQHQHVWDFGFDKIEFNVGRAEVKMFLEELARHKGKIADITAIPLDDFILFGSVR